MSRIEPRGEYADIAEKALYNGMLAGVSLDTQSFFYENPLEVHPDVIHFNDYYAQARDHMPPPAGSGVRLLLLPAQRAAAAGLHRGFCLHPVG